MKFFKKKTIPTQQSNLEMFLEDRDSMIQVVLDNGARHGLTLDFSNESIKEIDILLENIRKQYASDSTTTLDFETLTDEVRRQLPGVAASISHYIAACIEKNYGKGQWVAYSAPGEIDQPAYQLPDSKQIITPYNWVLKRVLNGFEDSIYTKYIYYMNS